MPDRFPAGITGFLNALTRWASTRQDILAVALVGSTARGTATDESDIDLVLLTNEWETYFKDTRWAETFGGVRRQEVEDWGRVTSFRVWYGSGLEVEYGYAAPGWAKPPFDDGTRRVIQGGLIALYDPQGLLTRATGA